MTFTVRLMKPFMRNKDRGELFEDIFRGILIRELVWYQDEKRSYTVFSVTFLSRSFSNL